VCKGAVAIQASPKKTCRLRINRTGDRVANNLINHRPVSLIYLDDERSLRTVTKAPSSWFTYSHVLETVFVIEIYTITVRASLELADVRRLEATH
jgi:hypothetical protein